jgi:hypothetical protein
MCCVALFKSSRFSFASLNNSKLPSPPQRRVSCTRQSEERCDVDFCDRAPVFDDICSHSNIVLD